MVYSEVDIIRTMYDEAPNGSNVGCVAILKAETLKLECRTWENQLFLLQGGFGCTPSASGNACFGKFCIDGERCREERYNFIGIANEEITALALEMLKKNNKENM